MPAILSRKRKAESDIEFSPPTSSASDVISSSCDNTPSTIPSSDDNEEEMSCEEIIPSTFSRFRDLTSVMKKASLLTCKRKSPLPDLNWADQKDLWHSLVLKDALYPRDYKVLRNHPELDARMWTILLDWLSEVCEVYRLHRETFYLARDYIHRYLIAKPNVPQNQLQLLGTTALFVASKMEEIYPPHMEQFAYVTDGACTVEEIRLQELNLLMTLKWSLSPITIIQWLNIYLQLAFVENEENFIQPGKYPRLMFVQICQVLDLCTLDLECFRFSYSLLSASAIAHFISKETAVHVSNLGWDQILPCFTWMKPFVEAAFEESVTNLKQFSDQEQRVWHDIQTHSVSMKLYGIAQEKQKHAVQRSSPSLAITQLTPPLSEKNVKV